MSRARNEAFVVWLFVYNFVATSMKVKLDQCAVSAYTLQASANGVLRD